MKRFFLFIFIIFILLIFFLPEFSKNMQNRSRTTKLGYTPQGNLFKAVLGEYRWFVGDYLAFKSIIYYGSQIENLNKHNFKEIEFYNLYRTVETSVLLNPYHEDSYYFAQAAFTWDIGRIKEVNSLLKYVANYRKWDHRIPFFLGFNYSYFLKDYKKAAYYFKQAAELSGSPLFSKLASRYFYESGDIELGIMFLEYMYNSTRREDIRRSYKLRLDALKAINRLQKQVDEFRKDYKRYPEGLKELVEKRYISRIPDDPYGGTFYLDENGRVRTSSQFVEKKGG